MSVLGAVLAGGQSRRFGSDKAVATWRGRPLIDHVIASLRSQVDTLLICGREWHREMWTPDHPRPDLGPLGGINAALAHAARHDMDYVLTVPCDVPTLPPALLRQLISCEGPTCLSELPVIGIWPATFAERLDRHLTCSNKRSMREWTALIGAREISLADGVTLPNINRMTDLEALVAHG